MTTPQAPLDVARLPHIEKLARAAVEELRRPSPKGDVAAFRELIAVDALYRELTPDVALRLCAAIRDALDEDRISVEWLADHGIVDSTFGPLGAGAPSRTEEPR